MSYPCQALFVPHARPILSTSILNEVKDILASAWPHSFIGPQAAGDPGSIDWETYSSGLDFFIALTALVVRGSQRRDNLPARNEEGNT
jgi:hypothetical protein